MVKEFVNMENRNLQRNIFERAHPFLYASDNIYLLLQVKLVILHILRIYENETFVESACDEYSVASSSDESEEAVNFIDTMDFISHEDDDLDDLGNM